MQNALRISEKYNYLLKNLLSDKELGGRTLSEITNSELINAIKYSSENTTAFADILELNPITKKIKKIASVENRSTHLLGKALEQISGEYIESDELLNVFREDVGLTDEEIEYFGFSFSEEQDMNDSTESESPSMTM